ncbi:hypothetical protein JMA_32470 [Jeotgalibacillus malaysiensis]|uniref:DinB-like domain-containing protein n=1 Tax=Jeotgalibacillus malaysiensis TaxID=1508404 RepID=A0A0B5AX23_9BACL|nr:DinB family protein [Jeotgalibacillus malaysiensis]AJD92564.1 hypothetical protein JMA_32470 [Jeotgalibacillus malaysiensis]
MNFSFEKTLEILKQTPGVLDSYLIGKSDDWLLSNEGEGTWNIYQIIDHLIEGERTNWMPRTRIFLGLEGDASKLFPPFDREANMGGEQSIEDRLAAFRKLREDNLTELKRLIKSDEDFNLKAQHPAFGEVSLRQMLATWAVHDLTHIAQITRVFAGHYREDVGPWEEYLGVLR